MTVKELRHKLAPLPDDFTVVFSDLLPLASVLIAVGIVILSDQPVTQKEK